MENLKHILPKNLQHLYIADEVIKQTSVFKNKRFDLSTLAKVLVSERHEKAELERLVFHLLCELDKKENLK